MHDRDDVFGSTLCHRGSVPFRRRGHNLSRDMQAVDACQILITFMLPYRMSLERLKKMMLLMLLITVCLLKLVRKNICDDGGLTQIKWGSNIMWLLLIASRNTYGYAIVSPLRLLSGNGVYYPTRSRPPAPPSRHIGGLVLADGSASFGTDHDAPSKPQGRRLKFVRLHGRGRHRYQSARGSFHARCNPGHKPMFLGGLIAHSVKAG